MNTHHRRFGYEQAEYGYATLRYTGQPYLNNQLARNMAKPSAEEPWPCAIIIGSVVIGYSIMLFHPLNDNLHLLIGLALVSSIYSRLYPPFRDDRQMGDRTEHDQAVYGSDLENYVDPLYPSVWLWKCLLVACEIAVSYVIYRDTLSLLIYQSDISLETYVQAFVSSVALLIILAYFGGTIAKIHLAVPRSDEKKSQ